MILEIIPELYDVEGRRSYKPHLKKGLAPPTYPFGRYVSCPLTVQCRNLQDLRAFLIKCKKMEDIEAFGRMEYWSPPDEFEKGMQGDCDDFALWTWRQLIQLGYSARFVAGYYGRYHVGHCWVTFESDRKQYLVEPMMAAIRRNLPQLQIFKYEPVYSVESDGNQVVFYSHQALHSKLGAARTLKLAVEWFWFWTVLCAKLVGRLLIFGPRHGWRRFKGKSQGGNNQKSRHREAKHTR